LIVVFINLCTNSGIISMKKGRKMVIGIESLFSWGTSCIFNLQGPPVKGRTPPEFHMFCDLDSHLHVATAWGSSHVCCHCQIRLLCQSQSPEVAPFQSLFRVSKMLPLLKEQIYNLHKHEVTTMVMLLPFKLLIVCLPLSSLPINPCWHHWGTFFFS